MSNDWPPRAVTTREGMDVLWRMENGPRRRRATKALKALMAGQPIGRKGNTR